MYRIKIYGKFIVWLLKKLLHFPLLGIAFIHKLMYDWKNQVRNDFGLSFMYLVLMYASSCIGGLLALLFTHGDNLSKQMFRDTFELCTYLSFGIYAIVLLLAAYDSFLEEYEQSFTKLKE